MPLTPKALKPPIPTYSTHGPASFNSKPNGLTVTTLIPLTHLLPQPQRRRSVCFACKKGGLEIAVPNKPVVVPRPPPSLHVNDCSRFRSATKNVDVSTLGNLCVDIVLNVPELPPPSVEERKAFMDRLASSPPDKVLALSLYVLVCVFFFFFF